MPFPLIATGASIIGSMIPGIVSSLAGAKTEEQARQAVKPQYEAMVSQMIGRGLPRREAEAQAEEAIAGELAKQRTSGALPGWAEALLGVAGGIGGWMAGAKLAGKAAAKGVAALSSAKPVPKALPNGRSAAETIVEDADTQMVKPFASRGRNPAKNQGRASDSMATTMPEQMAQTETVDLVRPFGRTRTTEVDPLASTQPLSTHRGLNETAIMETLPTDPALTVLRDAEFGDMAAQAAAKKAREMALMRQYADVQSNRGREDLGLVPAFGG